MKIKKFTYLLIFFFNYNPLFGQSILVDKISKNILAFNSTSMKLLDSLNIRDRFHVSRYYEYQDFNNDGLKDLFINYAGNPEKAYVSSLFLNSAGAFQNEMFVEDINYRHIQIGDFGFVTDLSYDFNSDGLRDIYSFTQNFHGRNGYLPDGYAPGKNNYPDGYLLNNGKGFDYLLGDDYYGWDYLQQKEPKLIDIDKDGYPNILFMNIQGVFGNEIVREDLGYRYLFYSYQLDKNNEWERNFHYKIPYTQSENNSVNYTESFPVSIDIKGDSVAYFLTVKYKNWNKISKTVSVFTGYPDQNNTDDYIVSESTIQKVDYSKGFDFENTQTLGVLKPEHPYQITTDWGQWWEDLDNDGKIEFIALQWGNNKSNDTRKNKISVFNLEGTEITDQFFSNNENYDNTDSHANGIHLVDIEGDGDLDIVPQNGWYEQFNGQWIYNIFINENGKFIKTRIDFRSNDNSSNFFDNGRWLGFKIPIDFNEDGVFEIMQIRMDNNIDIVYLRLGDDDSDGVKNSIDKCPSTPSGTKVNSDGCEIILALNNEPNGLRLYPNPFKDKLKVSFDESFGERVEVNIFDLNGKRAFSDSNVINGQELKLNKLSSGAYLLKIQSILNEKVSTIKIIKE